MKELTFQINEKTGEASGREYGQLKRSGGYVGV